MLQPVVLSELSFEQRSEWPSDSERTAEWLGSKYSARKWRVKGETKKPNTKDQYIDFEIPAANGLLTEHKKLYQAAKEYAFFVREHPASKLRDDETHVSMAREFLIFCSAATHRGITSLSEITRTELQSMLDDWMFGNEILLGAPEKVELFLAGFSRRDQLPPHLVYARGQKALVRGAVLQDCGLPGIGPMTTMVFNKADHRFGFIESVAELSSPTGELTRSGFDRKRGCLGTLYNLRSRARCENFAFNPAEIVVEGGKDVVPTPVAPPRLALSLMSHAAGRVKAEGEGLVSEADRGDDWTERSLDYAAVVWSLTAAFTARRREELALMRRDCLDGNDEVGWSVQVFVVKNLNDWAWIPIPSIVAAAIRNLIELSPSLEPSDPLFSVRCSKSEETRLLDGSVTRRIRKIAASCGADEYVGDNDEAKSWKWTPHQFRRFTAVLYFWGYAGSVAVISHILRHFNLGQTWGYTRYDQSLDIMWKEVAEEFKREIASEAVKGTLGGQMGKKLVRDTAKLERDLRKQMGSLQVIDPSRLLNDVLDLMSRDGLVIVPKAWTICACPASERGAKHAQCRKQVGEGTKRAIGPDFGRAGPTVCPSCPWAIENEVTRAFAKIELEGLKVSCTSSCLAGSVLGNVLETQLVAAIRVEDRRAS